MSGANDNVKSQIAKSLTELAIQNKCIELANSNEETAKIIADFYNTIRDNLN